MKGQFRKLLITTLLIGLSWGLYTPIYAQDQLARINPYILGGGVVVAAGGTETGGDTNVEADDWAISSGVKYCSIVFVPVNSGTASTFSIYGTNSDSTTDIKVAIYTDAVDHENIPYTLIGQIEVSNIGTFTTAWKDIDISSASIAITASKNTYVCFQISADTITGKRQTSSGSMLYAVDAYANNFANPFAGSPGTQTASYHVDWVY